MKKLVPAHSGSPKQNPESRKTVVVVVLVIPEVMRNEAKLLPVQVETGLDSMVDYR